MDSNLNTLQRSGFHSLYDSCYQTIRLFSVTPEDADDDTVMDKHGAYALYSAVKSLMHAIRTEDHNVQQDVAHQMIQIANPWMITRFAKSILANGKPLVPILKENAHIVDLEWNEDEQANLKTYVERYTPWCASEAWRLHI